MIPGRIARSTPLLFCLTLLVPLAQGQESLSTQLLAESPEALAAAARAQGDPSRGAIVFHRSASTCTQCHDPGGQSQSLGPDLARPAPGTTDVHLVESILSPSKTIRQGFETLTIATTDGRVITGLLAEDRPEALLLRDPARPGATLSIPRADIDEQSTGGPSLMPAGLAELLGTRQHFLDLVRYLIDVRDGGPARALALRPDPALLSPPLPSYENDLDHAGLLANLGPDNFNRGQAIYERLCVNCHGTPETPGSLPTSLRFASGTFKNGGDPFRLYQTITHGYGQMAPQSWMVPRQKYDVIHYLREAYLKPLNPSQYTTVDKAYLASLPAGSTFGPEPSNVEPWAVMDYGPSLAATYEAGDTGNNFAYKGIAVRLDAGPGGVSRGRHWMIFDHDTMRMAAAWSGQGFINWQGINFDGRHQAHPRLVGSLAFENQTGPGWANPANGQFTDPRLRGRDDRPYGPLPRDWAHYKGHYRSGDRHTFSYSIGQTDILESPTVETAGRFPVFIRTLDLGPSSTDLTLEVAHLPFDSVTADNLPTSDHATQKIYVSRDPGHPGALAVRASSNAGPPLELQNDPNGQVFLKIPASTRSRTLELCLAQLDHEGQSAPLIEAWQSRPDPASLAPFTHGGPSRWPDPVITQILPGQENGSFAVDQLTLPVPNPWSALVRPSGFDFTPPGDQAIVCSWDGDVYRVSGITSPEGRLHWRRIASGLFQPLGLKIVNGRIHVACRDQIVILNDLDGDGETDFYENFNNDHQVSEHFHEFAMGLQTDSQGNFYYTKAARHALPALFPQHGTLLRVSPDGKQTDILATGFRAPNGVCLNPDGTCFLTDQEGHWTPKNRLNWIQAADDARPRFYGNMWAFTDVTDTSNQAMEPPVCWITNDFDRSPAEPLWVPPDTWGPLAGSLLVPSYGYGKFFVVPHTQVGPLMQGGLSPLPLPELPTGIIRARFHPASRHLYACGLFAWAGSRTEPGGFYRIRYTGKPAHVITAFKPRAGALDLTFSDPLAPLAEADTEPPHVEVKAWSLKRSANYGSDHIDEHALDVASTSLSADRRTLTLAIPSLAPTTSFAVSYTLTDAAGTPFEGQFHGTIHRLED